MKITKVNAVAFLVGLGFEEAGEWSNEKIQVWLGKVYEKAEKAPKGFENIFNQLKEEAGAPVTVIEEEKGAPVKTSKLTRKELLVIIEEEQLTSIKVGKKTTVEQLVTMIQNARKAKTETETRESKDLKKDGIKKERVAKEPRKTIEKDFMGGRIGTMSSKVNVALTKTWQPESEIETKCGLGLRLTRTRLYAMESKGKVERRHVIEYRFKPD